MAEKIYTIDEINKINGAASATKDAVYTDVVGNKYVGLSNGYFHILQRATVTPTNAISGIASTTVQGGLEELSSRLSTVEVSVSSISGSFVTEAELDTAEEDLKGFAVAMAVML